MQKVGAANVAGLAWVVVALSSGACGGGGAADAGGAVDAGLEDTGLADSGPQADAERTGVDGGPRVCPDAGPAADAGPGGVVYTETRAPCASRNANRNVYFGDLHIHTTLSFDSLAGGNPATPEDAYRFARGQEIEVYGGAAPRRVRLGRPLDFAGVTDHSELLAEVDICSVPGSPGYDSQPCQVYRRGGIEAFTELGLPLAATQPRRSRQICGREDCATRLTPVWERVQRAAQEAYDTTSACTFTAFIAYEYTYTPTASMLHRNVIFRNSVVPAAPVTTFEALPGPDLWRRLLATCNDQCNGCDVLTIPHNSNYSSGRMFDVAPLDTLSAADRREHDTLRARMEPLVEIYQHKASSECRADFQAMGAPDELCNFEVLDRSLITQQPVPDCDSVGPGLQLQCASPLDYVRRALGVGLEEEARTGVNPYRYGFIGSTDTHNGMSGGVEENNYRGHLAAQDLEALSLADNSPGGLAAVWSVENSRDALFEAMRRRETYATSGTRMSVRFFGGWGYDAALCSNPQLVGEGYAGGVPMGGILPTRPGTATAPRFVLSAAQDATPLQRTQIIKGWLDASGNAMERVYEVGGNPANGASVDLATCATSGPGSASLCTVWTDPDFDPARPAWWYARVVENPTCRWSQWQCIGIPEAQRPAGCSDPEVAKTVQERAWSSPIWYVPAG